jgi:hypothetical protein
MGTRIRFQKNLVRTYSEFNEIFAQQAGEGLQQPFPAFKGAISCINRARAWIINVVIMGYLYLTFQQIYRKQRGIQEALEL